MIFTLFYIFEFELHENTKYHQCSLYLIFEESFRNQLKNKKIEKFVLLIKISSIFFLLFHFYNNDNNFAKFLLIPFEIRKLTKLNHFFNSSKKYNSNIFF